MCGLSLVVVRGGFSCCAARVLGAWASVVVARGLSSCGSRALERRLSSCGTRAQLLRGMWDLPGPGLEPVSPALAGGFLTIAPPGKSKSVTFRQQSFSVNKAAIVIKGHAVTTHNCNVSSGKHCFLFTWQPA